MDSEVGRGGNDCMRVTDSHRSSLMINIERDKDFLVKIKKI